MNELAQIRHYAWAIAKDPKANRIERLEALKLVCAVKGILLPDISEEFLSVKQAVQLRRAKQDLVEKALARKEKVKVKNRKQYLKRKLRKLEAQGEEDQNDQ